MSMTLGPIEGRTARRANKKENKCLGTMVYQGAKLKDDQ